MIQSQPHCNRQETILEFYPLVNSIVRKFAARLPSHVDQDDLLSIGLIGLIEAYDRFDASKGIPFQTYASIRVRGAIFDSLRKEDWVPRSVRQRANQLDYTIAQLRKELGRQPKHTEIATKLKMTSRRLERMQRNSVISSLISLDTPIGDQENSLLIDMVSCGQLAIDEEMHAAELLAFLLYRIEFLNPREKTIINMFYFTDKSIKEIADVFGLTKSRVCQLRKDALQSLRTAIMAHFAR